MKLNSFLSPHVAYLLCELPKSEITENSNEELNEDESWKMIHESICENKLHTSDDYICAIKTMLPLAKKIGMSQNVLWNEHDDLYAWLSRHGDFPESFSLDDSAAKKMTSLLKFVSIFERALGDVCVACGTQCPFLLRDLVLLDELKASVGEENMKLLQILIGNPNGVNLRNLAWHGFLVPDEIPDLFIALLVFVSKKIVQEVKLMELTPRPLIHSSPPLDLLSTILSGHSCFTMANIGCKLLASPLSLPMVKYMEEAFCLFDEGRYGDCVVLLLPCIENFMRIIFATVNDCEGRILTAESSQLYTTMDEVLAQFDGDGKKNRFCSAAGDNLMMILIDLFTLPDGPRLRDRLSHGEMALEVVSRPVASLVIMLALKFYSLAGQLTNSASACVTSCQSNSIDPGNCCYIYSLVENFDEFVSKYHPLFHPLCIAFRSHSMTISNLNLWKTMPRPEFRGEACVIAETAYAETPIVQVRNALFRNAKGEMEVTGLLRRIAKECEKSSGNIVGFMRERWRMYNDRSLRSRQRSNYENMISRMTEIHDVIARILHQNAKYFHLVINQEMQEHDLATILREMRRLLKTAENLRTLTSLNKWADVCLLKPS